MYAIAWMEAAYLILPFWMYSMEAQVLQAYGLSQEDFQKGIMSHQADPSLHEAIQSMQVREEKSFLGGC
jgi:hypothetical protein